VTGNIATVALLRHGGSHLIRPIVSRLGFEIIEPGNFGAPLDQAVGPVIVFLRDPRDRMVSTLRWWREKPRKADMLGGESGDDAQLRYLLEKRGFLAEMLVWANVWCRWTKTVPYKVKFETISPGVIGGIANHLGLPHNSDRDEKIFSDVYGHGRTYTGRHSKWRESFGPMSIEYWNNNGGRNLLDMMGYV
jgi:hypothetical protein